MIPIQQRMKIPEAPVDEKLYQFACEMRVAIPGIVLSFDSGSQWGFPSISVQIAIREVILQNAAPVIVEIPPLDAVPVLYPGGGGFSLTHPLAAGDEVMLLFSDAAIDFWKQNGGVQKQPDGVKFRHDIGDAIAIPGLRSAARPLANFSTSSAQLRSDDGTVVIDLAEAGVTITAPAITAQGSDAMPQALVNQAWLTWFTTDFYPWAVAHGYTGPVQPMHSATMILKGE